MIEITKVLIDFLRVVSVGKDINQGLVGKEIKSGEDLFLLIQVFMQSFSQIQISLKTSLSSYVAAETKSYQ